MRKLIQRTKQSWKAADEEATTKAVNGTQEALLVINILAYSFTLIIATIYTYNAKNVWLWVGLVMAYRGMIPAIYKETKDFFTLFKANLEEERRLRKITDDTMRGKK